MYSAGELVNNLTEVEWLPDPGCPARGTMLPELLESMRRRGQFEDMGRLVNPRRSSFWTRPRAPAAAGSMEALPTPHYPWAESSTSDDPPTAPVFPPPPPPFRAAPTRVSPPRDESPEPPSDLQQAAHGFFFGVALPAVAPAALSSLRTDTSGRFVLPPGSSVSLLLRTGDSGVRAESRVIPMTVTLDAEARLYGRMESVSWLPETLSSAARDRLRQYEFAPTPPFSSRTAQDFDLQERNLNAAYDRPDIADLISSQGPSDLLDLQVPAPPDVAGYHAPQDLSSPVSSGFLASAGVSPESEQSGTANVSSTVTAPTAPQPSTSGAAAAPPRASRAYEVLGNLRRARADSETTEFCDFVYLLRLTCNLCRRN